MPASPPGTARVGADSRVGHRAGSPGFRRISAALWSAGVGTFMLLYAVQALLPALSETFEVSPSTSSLALSVATGALALALLPVSAVAESWGHKRVISVSLTAAAVLGLLVPLAPSFEVLLGLRGLQGLAMAGVPALAMAYLAREVDGRSLGHAMGMLIAGNTVGGLSGRLIAGLLADVAGWRVAMAVVGVLSLLCLVAFRLLIPPPLRAAPRARAPRALVAEARALLRDPGVRRICLVSFVLMSAFVTVYNYLGFRLLASPFLLSQAAVGLVFVVYLTGTASSTIAGLLGDRVGRLRVLSASIGLGIVAAALSLPDLLPSVLAALVLLTMSFFAAHSVASSWLSERATSAQASALYLFSYYAGSSLGGAAGGIPFERAAWPGVVAFVVALLLVALANALMLGRARSRDAAQRAVGA